MQKMIPSIFLPPPPQKYVRVHFNYDGRLDDELPCKALGLSFQKGDIMEISNQDDPDWWQVGRHS